MIIIIIIIILINTIIINNYYNYCLRKARCTNRRYVRRRR
jgi:hypothetical protein